MHRQTLVPGALEALGRIGEVADIVILTNLGDEAHPWRVAQLAAHGIPHEVVCNQGGKGVPARAIIERLGAGATAFVDDLPVHHASVAKHAPEVWRLHMVAEPRLAPAVPPAAHAHARIDDWPTACDWIIERLEGEMTKTIFITGATAGIGAAAARKFVGQGWQVVGTGRRRDRLDALAAELGDSFHPLDARHARCRWISRRRSPRCRTAFAASTCCSTMPAWPRR